MPNKSVMIDNKQCRTKISSNTANYTNSLITNKHINKDNDKFVPI